MLPSYIIWTKTHRVDLLEMMSAIFKGKIVEVYINNVVVKSKKL